MNSFVILIMLLAYTAATDFSVAITAVSGQSFEFETGFGVPGTTVNVEVWDKCRSESDGSRTAVGELYPASTVQGLQADHSGIANIPGTGNSLSFGFVEGITHNYDIYTNLGGNMGQVAFCAQVNVYIGDFLANFAEVKLTYNINLETDVAISPQRSSLFDLSVGAPESSAAVSAAPASTTVDGAYFCDPETRNELDVNVYQALGEGSSLHLCFSTDFVNTTTSDVTDVSVTSLTQVPNGTSVEDVVRANDYDNLAASANLSCTSIAQEADSCVLSLDWESRFHHAGFITLANSSNSGTRNATITIELSSHQSTGARQRNLRHTSKGSSSSSPAFAIHSSGVFVEESVKLLILLGVALATGMILVHCLMMRSGIDKSETFQAKPSSENYLLLVV